MIHYSPSHSQGWRDVVVTCDKEFVGVRVRVEPGEGVVELVVCTRLDKIA